MELRQLPGILKRLDVTDLSVPTEELRAYLVARYQDRFDVYPKKYEEMGAGVFSEFGVRVRVTSFSGDEGIDIVVLDGDNNATVGIQVKRHRGKIEAESIRSFVGALLLQGLTAGIYVTTSEYQRGALRTAAAARGRLGIGVTLLDSKRFYEALQITPRATHWSPEDPSAPYYECWQDVHTYLAGPPLAIGRGEAWIERAGYTWGSGW